MQMLEAFNLLQCLLQMKTLILRGQYFNLILRQLVNRHKQVSFKLKNYDFTCCFRILNLI